MTKVKWERLKKYIESFNSSDNGAYIKEAILNQMDYMESIDDEGNPLKL